MAKNKLALIGIFLILGAVIVNAEEDDYGKKIEEAADKIKDLIEKYQKMEIDFVKQEIVSIKDEQGNPKDCDVAIFYNNGKQARFSTKNGQFDGNFNHKNVIPKKPLSIRLSNCPCTPISAKFEQTWLEINQVLAKIKKTIEDEIKEKGQEKAKEIAEDAIKKVFEKLGYGAAASGFLTGFGIGASLGAPIGEYITETINKILDLAREQNLGASEFFDDAPLRPNIGWVSPRGAWGNFWGESPQLQNKWDITVNCGTKIIAPADATWVPAKDVIVKQPVAQVATTPKTDSVARDTLGAEQRYRDEQADYNREREAREQQEREAARLRYEDYQRELRQKAQEIAQTCPLCEPIRKQMEQVSAGIKNAEQEIPKLENEVADSQNKAEQAKKQVENAQQRLDNFKNPKSYIQDSQTGKRVTSSDVEVKKTASQQNWESYARGEQTAQQTVKNWESFDQEALEKAKKETEQRLEKEAREAEQKLQQAQQKLNKAMQEFANAQRNLEQLKKELEKLKQQLEECLKLCKEHSAEIAKGMYTSYQDLLMISKPQLKTQTPCERYEVLIKTATGGKFGTADYEGLSNEIKQKFVSPAQDKAIYEAGENCYKTKTIATTARYTTPVATPSQPKIAPKTCEETCKSREMATTKKDWSAQILSKLNSEGQCRKTARINYGQTITTGECACYPTSPPSIDISSELLVCKGTSCGDVPCGSSKECSCGERCTVTVQCSWGGWKQAGENQFIPFVQAVQ